MIEQRLDPATEANKLVYNTLSNNYESLDGRRNPRLERWLRHTVSNLLQKHDANASFLDVACGSGFFVRTVRDLFKETHAFDISEVMVQLAAKFCDHASVRDAYSTNYEPNRFSFIGCFAGLHHFSSPDRFFQEAFRILMPGGVLYTDHDMERLFADRFKPLLKVYRRFLGNENHYMEQVGITRETYDLAEYNSGGVSGALVEAELRKIGFSEVNVSYHWYGLNPMVDRVFGQKHYRHGMAPILRIVAIK